MSHLCSDIGPHPHRQCANDRECHQHIRTGWGHSDTVSLPFRANRLQLLYFYLEDFTMDFLRACVLCAAFLTLTKAFTHHDMKDALLQKLGLDEVPKIHKRDLENMVIPTHIKNKYASMLKLHHSRRRRSLPSLAGILRGIPGNAGKNRLNC